MPKLDQAVIDRLARPMHQVFDQIAMDAAGFIDGNQHAVEMTIDANRLDMLGGDREADELVRALVDEHGYEAVLRFLSRHVKLY